jgi:hypothetical protein
MAGVDHRAVAELMGDSSIERTMRYAHLAAHNRAPAGRLKRGGNHSRELEQAQLKANWSLKWS